MPFQLGPSKMGHSRLSCKRCFYPGVSILSKMFTRLPHLNRLQRKVKPFYVLHCRDTPVADMEVQFLSDIVVAE